MKKKKLDNILGIEPENIEHEIIDYDDLTDVPGTTYNSSNELTTVVHDDYDAKDNEIESQFDEIFTKALDAYDEQIENTEDLDGKYMARNSEVAAMFLNTALNAAKEKAALKTHSDKLKVAKEKNTTGSNVTNNNLIIDRNQLLKMLEGDNNEES